MANCAYDTSPPSMRPSNRSPYLSACSCANVARLVTATPPDMISIQSKISNKAPHKQQAHCLPSPAPSVHARRAGIRKIHDSRKEALVQQRSLALVGDRKSVV